MLLALHTLIAALYLILPPAALVTAIVRAKRTRTKLPVTSFVFTAAAGLVLGIALNLVYMTATRGRIIPMQVVLAGYFGTGMLLLLKLFDHVFQLGLDRVFGIDRIDRTPTVEPVTSGDDAAHPQQPVVRRRGLRTRAFLAAFVRVVVLFGVGLPYVMAAVLTYRPKVAPGRNQDPKEQLGFAYERVTFEASDGMNLVGWWIPALPRRSLGQLRAGADDEAWGTRTVLVCHGLAASKANQLVMAAPYPPAGFNVLIFDFRAHGESGGQLTTFGDRERCDVLGAVRWLREHRSGNAREIFGVGASQGAAALIAAAADDGPDGQAINALAVYGTYDSLPALTRSIAGKYFFPPLRQLLIHVGLPVAAAQTGANLPAFAPAALAHDVWPRPILFVHGRRDEIIDFTHGERLYERASHPKYALWLDADHNAIIDNETAATIVVEFFKSAEPVPVI